MEPLLDELCTILDEELERQENLLGITQAQQAAILARDVAEVEAKAAASQLLVRDVILGEARRVRVLSELAKELGLAQSRVTLTELVRVAPGPWQSRLRFFQVRLSGVMEQTRSLVRENSFLLRRSLRMVDQCLRHLQPGPAAPASQYTPSGHEPAAVRHAATFVNQRG